MLPISRAAGVGLLVYGLGTTLGAAGTGSPGGDYEASMVRDYVASSHWLAAFGLWYVAALSAIGLVVAGAALRRLGGWLGDVLWGLAVAGTAASVVGAFVSGGLVVAMAEGGEAVQAGVPHPVVYTLTEIGNLLAVCAPALFVGVAAVLLAARVPMPRWLRVFSVVAGVCGVLAPLYFTYPVFLLWTVVVGIALLRSGARTTVPGPAPVAVG